MSATKGGGGRLTPRRALALLPEGFESRDLQVAELKKDQKKLTTEALRIAATDGRVVVRRNTARAFEVLADGDPTLLVLLRDSEGTVQRVAAEAVAALPNTEASLILEGIKGLGDATAPARAILVQRTTELIGKANEDIFRALNSSARGVEAVLEALERGGEQAVKMLTEALQHPSLLVRLNAARTLARMIRHGVVFDPVLLEPALDDPIDEVRRALSPSYRALVAAQEVGADLDPLPEAFDGPLFDDEAAPGQLKAIGVKRLVLALQDGREAVRVNAAAVLAHAKKLDPLGQQRLAVLLKDSEPDVRLAAARALAELEAEPELVYPEVLNALTNAQTPLKEALLLVLERGGDDALPHLLRALDAPSAHVRATVLPMLDRWDARLVKPLVGVVKNSARSERSRRNAVMLLEACGAAEEPDISDVIETFRASLEPPRSSQLDLVPAFQRPSRAAEATKWPVQGFDEAPLPDSTLKKAKKELSIEWLGPALQDGRAVVRLNALTGMVILGKEAAPASYQIAVRLRDHDPGVTAAAARALGAIGPLDDGVVMALFNAVPDVHPNAHAALREAIDGLGDSALELLLKALKRDPVGAFRPASIVAPWFAEWFAEPLAKLLNHDRHKVRSNAARLLRMLGPAVQSVQKEVMQALDASGKDNRVILIDTLAHTKPNKMLLQWLESLWAVDHSRATRHALRKAFEAFDHEVPEEPAQKS